MVGRWLVLSSRRVYYHARASVVPLFKRAHFTPDVGNQPLALTRVSSVRAA